MSTTARRGTAIALALLLFGVAGCLNSPVAPSDGSPDLNIPVAPTRAVGGLVTGNGHLPTAPLFATVTFHARSTADGEVSGTVTAVARRRGNTRYRVELTCLHVNGNQAWASGTVVSSTDPDAVGMPMSFQVVDNGEGGKADPDLMGGYFGAIDCASEPSLELFPLTIGNLQVHELGGHGDDVGR